jgi:hypothetical protein
MIAWTPRALHADAGAHRIDVALARVDGDLGAVAGSRTATANHHRAVVDLRTSCSNSLISSAGSVRDSHDLRPFGAAVDALDHGAIRSPGV